MQKKKNLSNSASYTRNQQILEQTSSVEKDEEQPPAQMDGEKDINKRTEEKEKRGE